MAQETTKNLHLRQAVVPTISCVFALFLTRQPVVPTFSYVFSGFYDSPAGFPHEIKSKRGVMGLASN